MARRRKSSEWHIGSGGAVFAFLAALILGAAIYTQNNLLFWALGLVVGALVASVLLAWQTLRGLEVERVLPAHAVAGEATPLRYRVTNRKTWLPVFGLVIGESWGGRWRRRGSGPVEEVPPRLASAPLGMVLHVGPRQTVQAEALCWPLRRGPLRLERITLSTAFPFGIVRRVVHIEQRGEMLVYPHLFRVSRRVLYRLARQDASGRYRLNRSGGHEEFYGVRDYREGDSPKMIDWKRTARTGDLVSREMHQASPPKVVVALDLSKLPPTTPGPPRQPTWWERLGLAPRPATPQRDPAEEARREAEDAINLTASIICDAHFRGYQIGMAVLGVRCESFQTRHSLPHRTRMLEALARLDLSDRVTQARWVVEPPSVVVRPGGQAARGDRNGGPTVMTVADLGEHVRDLEGGSHALLSRAAESHLRHHQLREVHA